MALIKCPECGKDLSTVAKACPHCGFIPANNEHASIVSEAETPQARKTNSFKPAAIVILVVFVLVLAIAILYVTKDNTKNFTENTSEAADTGHVINAEKLPAKIKYNNNLIALESVEAYEMKLEHSYAVFLVSKFDLSGLDEDSRYWLTKNDLDYNIYITNSKNGYDYYSAVKLGNVFYTDTNELVYVHTSSFLKDNRYPFTNSKFSLSLNITQEDTYEYVDSKGNTSERHKINKLNYSYSSEGTLKDFENLSTSLKKQIEDWLYKRADSYKN